MAINNPYVPGDPFSYDLKWLVRKIKEHDTIFDTLDERIRDLIVQLLDQHDPLYWESADALIHSDMKAPSLAYIEGFYEPGDGGANLYYVTSDYNDILSANFHLTLDGANRWAIPILTTPYVTPEMFGAYGDGSEDDSESFETALRFGLPLYGMKNKEYLANIHFQANNGKITDVNLKGSITFEPNLYFINIENCDIDATGKNYGIYSNVNLTKLRINNTHVHDAVIDNVHLEKIWDASLNGLSVTGAGDNNIYLSEFNNGTWNGTSYFSENRGVYVRDSKACTITATIQECKKTGFRLEGVLGSTLRLYLEQNGYDGTTDEEKSQMIIGTDARCIGNDITFFAIGGSGSSMESKYGLYLARSENSNYNGYAEGHTSDGFRCTSNSKMNCYNVLDKTHVTITSDWQSCTPKMYGFTSVTGNTSITLDGGANFNYIPVVDSGTAYMVSFQKTGSTTGIIRITDYNGTNVSGVSARLYKYGTGITTV